MVINPFIFRKKNISVSSKNDKIIIFLCNIDAKVNTVSIYLKVEVLEENLVH